MAEYINRDDLLKAAWDKPTLALSVYDIGNIKPVDVAPVRRGRWITTSVEVFPGSSILCYSHRHEECGFQCVDMSENGYDYCPNCGCRMVGGLTDG